MDEPLYLDACGVYRASQLDAFPWLIHGFGTRNSPGWPGDWRISTVRQIHSGTVLPAGASGGVIGEGDALITNALGTRLAIRTADCLPILIADGRRRAVAAIHAGWRGTVAGICSNAVRAMMDRFGTEVSDLVAVVGPGIAECCFEVGPEVGTRFQTIFPEREDLGGKARINLAEANSRQLRRIGVPAGQIVRTQLCTCCPGSAFYSYRRERDGAGRMVSLIGINET